MIEHLLRLLVSAAMICGAALSRAQAQPQPTADAAAAASQSSALPSDVQDRGWPRSFETADHEIIIHQPQVDEWPDFGRLSFRAAIAITKKGEAEPTYGTVRVSAATKVSKAERLVLLSDRKVEGVTFPDAPAAAAESLTAMVMAITPPDQAITLSLDRIIAQLDLDQVKVRQVEVSLAPPRIVSSATPAVMVIFMGKPRFKPVPDSDLMFAINTNWDVFMDPGAASYYLLNDKTWLVTDDLEKGAWAATTELPASLSKLPADENWSDVRAALPPAPATAVPSVFVAFEPAELVVTEGEPELQPIPGTKLMMVANTESPLFFNTAEKQYYLLAAGRWFKAAALSGPWAAASAALPEDFRSIPEDSDAAGVLPAVPGTAAAKEAVILASIPEKATISRTEVTVNVTYDGEPQLKPIETTTVQYVFNTPYSVFLVKDTYYCCHNAVWFESPHAKGPWAVCDAVPAVIYTIPPTSPKHHVTYVTVYESTPTTVVTGYTAGYSGETVAATGAVMFGLGLLVGAMIADDDDDYWYYHYHSGSISYGCGAHYHYGSGGYVAGGAAYGPYGGAGRYAAYNPHTGVYSRGAAVYGPNGAAGIRTAYNPATGTAGYRAGGSNAYGSWGRAGVSRGDDWVRGGYRSGPGGSVGAIQGSGGAAAIHGETRYGNGATVVRGQEGDVYAGKDGNVYQKTEDGWEQKSGANRPGTTGSTTAASTGRTRTAATPTAAPTDRGTAAPTTAERPSASPAAASRQAPASAGDLSREATARNRGETNASRFQQSRSGGRSAPSWSGGGSRGGGARGGGGRR